MGRLVYSMSGSLDGFVETPNRSLDWVLVDEELHSEVLQRSGIARDHKPTREPRHANSLRGDPGSDRRALRNYAQLCTRRRSLSTTRRGWNEPASARGT
jgi:hypothetical protein